MALYNLKKKNNTTDNSNTIFKVSVDCFSLICFNLFVTTGKKQELLHGGHSSRIMQKKPSFSFYFLLSRNYTNSSSAFQKHIHGR